MKSEIHWIPNSAYYGRVLDLQTKIVSTLVVPDEALNLVDQGMFPIGKPSTGSDTTERTDLIKKSSHIRSALFSLDGGWYNILGGEPLHLQFRVRSSLPSLWWEGRSALCQPREVPGEIEVGSQELGLVWLKDCGADGC
jgi:hypothetical protein